LTPEEAIREAQSGNLRPVYLAVGEERVLIERVVSAVRKAALHGGVEGFNEDKLTAGEAEIDQVLNAVRTVPMLARWRLVLLRAVDRWDGHNADSERATSDRGAAALDRLAAYCADPAPTSCLLMTATKLDGRRKFVQQAKKSGFWVACDPVSRRDLPVRIGREAKDRGHEIAPEVADLLAEMAGPELANVIDAIERLSLYVGPSAPITEDAVAECVMRVRVSTVWELVAAVARRDTATALAVIDDVYDPQDRGLRLVGLVAWSVRQLVRFSAARSNGSSAEDAARAAGVAPFKAREVASQVSRLRSGDLEWWVAVLAQTDLALKGSKRPPRAVLESAILTMMTRAPR
jgi:DNA polymerase III subunit delta